MIHLNKANYIFIGIMTITLVGIWCLIDYPPALTVKSENEKYTTLQFKQDTFKLGEVKLGGNREITFNYTNTGKYPLIIKNVQTTCGCTEAQWNKEPLLPAQTNTIKINFKGEDEGHFQKTIFVVCNIWQKVYRLQIMGEVTK